MPSPKPTLEAKKVYLKDVSFESPLSPLVFAGEPPVPEVDTQMHLGHTALDGKGLYEMVLRVTVTATHKKRTVFVAEVQQAGIFLVIQPDPGAVEYLLGTACPYTLLPFAREAISSLVTKAGFPQLLVGAVNFEQMYRKRGGGAADTTPPADA